MSVRRIIILVLAVLAIICAASIYFFYDPSQSSLFPRCIFYSLTDLKCPGCGSQRAIHALLHADCATAWRYNAALVASLPIIALYLFAELTRNRHIRLYRTLNSPTAVWAVLILVIFWWIMRNIFGW